MGSGGGFAKGAPDDPDRLEHHGWHEWEGQTLVEHSRWKLRGVTLTFDRRLTFSSDKKELQIAERASGPAGEVRHDSTLPLE